MEQRPEQPPEGKLIADAADRLSLSIREAARRAGISYGRWRQIVTGYQNVSPGNYAPVHAPARTVARMAAVVGVTPEQMETQGGRPDVAEILRQEIAAVPPLSIVPPVSLERRETDLLPDMDAAMRKRSEAHIPAIQALVLKAALSGPLTGARIFPDSPYEAARWDLLSEIGQSDPSGPGYSPWQMIRLMAVGRVLDDEKRAGNRPAQEVLIPT